jgi:23S rRNA pseudouridine2457 synthase
MESQFISPYAGDLLGDIKFDFPAGTHAIGRLDKYSEGLLLLTTNKKITALLFQSRIPHKRTYLVQVKHKVSPQSLEQLRNGISIRIRGGDYYTTPPCEVNIVNQPADYVPHLHETTYKLESTWLTITLTEGKFHQVRKMVLAVRHKCIRLIRISIEDLELGDLPAGQVTEMEEGEFFRLLKI